MRNSIVMILILLIFQLITSWFASASNIEDSNVKYIINTDIRILDMHELIREFDTIITQFEKGFYLNLENEDVFDREACGLYKVIPYYQKIYPQDQTQNRYIIQKHPFHDEFQLIKIENYLQWFGTCYGSKNIKSIGYDKLRSTDNENLMNIMLPYEEKLDEISRISEIFEKKFKEKKNVSNEMTYSNKMLSKSLQEKHSNLLIDKNQNFQEILIEKEEKINELMKLNENLKNQLKEKDEIVNKLVIKKRKLEKGKENIIKQMKNEKQISEQKEIDFQQKEEEFQQKEEKFYNEFKNETETEKEKLGKEKEEFNQFKLIEQKTIEKIKSKIEDEFNAFKFENEKNKSKIEDEFNALKFENEKNKNIIQDLKQKLEKKEKEKYKNESLSEEITALQNVINVNKEKLKNNMNRKQDEIENLTTKVNTLTKKVNMLTKENLQLQNTNKYVKQNFKGHIDSVTGLFQQSHKNFANQFPITFLKVFNKETQQKLKYIMICECNKNPNDHFYADDVFKPCLEYPYEQSLIHFGRWLNVEMARKMKMLPISDEGLFNPISLEIKPAESSIELKE